MTEPDTTAAPSAKSVLPWTSRVLPLALTFCLGTGISCAAYFLVQRSEKQRTDREFDWRSRSHAQALRVGVERFEECLYTMRDLYYATANVSAAEFRDTSTDLMQRHPGIHLLQWMPEVRAEDRDTFEAKAGKGVFPGYMIVEHGEPGAGNVRAGEAAVYAPVLLVEPRAHKTNLLGIDWYRGVHRVTLFEARDSGEITATPRLQLSPAPNLEVGWAMSLPLYTNGTEPKSVDERRSRLRGYIQGQFRLSDLVSQPIQEPADEPMEILLMDCSAEGDDSYLIGYSNGVWRMSGPPLDSDFLNGFHRAYEIKVGGRDWHVYFRPTAPSLNAQITPYAFAALAGGLILTVMIGALVLSAQRRAQLVARQVEQRTAELREAQETLREDIRRREAVEQALRDSEDRYRAFVSQSTEAIWRFEHEPPIPTHLPVDEQIDLMYRHARLAECNDVMAKMYGYASSEEMIGASIEQIAPRDDPQNAAYFRAFVENDHRVTDWETREVDRHGNAKYFLNNEIGTVEGGLLKHAWGTQRDITERKRQSERQLEQDTRLRLAVAAANLGTWEWDLRTNRIVGSAETMAIFGLDPSEHEIPVERYVSRVHPDDRKRLGESIQRALQTPVESMADYRIRVVRPGGEVRWLVLRGALLRDNQGVAVRRLGTVMDVTAEHHAEEEKARIEHKLQETQKLESLGVLAGGIAHDFNNLLTGILGNASLARLDLPPNSPAQPSLEQIELVAQRAADLCKQMLAYSGKGRFIVQKLDLSMLVRDTADLLRLSISKNSVLKFSLNHTLPAISVDATQMRQILMNLAINASEAIGENSGVITITTGLMHADRAYLTEAHLSPSIPEGSYVYLEVSDNGAGMDAETRDRIFDPFFTTKFTGRGLGLAAVLGIVRGHQGALKVYSEPGKGTTFKVLLPRAEGPAEHLPVRLSASSSWRGAGTMLVVDDEDSVRTVSSRMLSALGFHVLQATNGSEAVELFLPHRDEIVGVLLDLTMPELDGAATFTEMRKIKPDIRVLLMSGFNEQDAVNRFAGKGLAGFIQKPFKPEILQSKLRAMFETALENQLNLFGDGNDGVTPPSTQS